MAWLVEYKNKYGSFYKLLQKSFKDSCSFVTFGDFNETSRNEPSK